MMTRREAQQRATLHGARIMPTGKPGEFRVTLEDWFGKYAIEEIAKRAMIVEDIEDAVLAASKLRSEENVRILRNRSRLANVSGRRA